MDLRQIEYFICLYEQGSVTRASQRLNVVQPAVSMQIAKIERELGLKLFDRTAQGMSPTSAARRMYQLFLPVLRDLTHARQQVASLNGKITGHVSVGLVTSVAQSVLASSIFEFSLQFPEVELSIVEGYSSDLIDAVSVGKLDIAVINRPPKNVGLATDPILQEEFVVVSSGKAKKKFPSTVRLKDIVGDKLVLPSKRNGLRNILDHHAEHLGIRIAPRLEIDPLPAVVELVAASGWITILPTILVNRGIRNGSLRASRLRSPEIKRNLVWIDRARQPLSVASQHFIKVINKNLASAASAPLTKRS